MKRCPQCGRTYADEALIYCLNDGTLLLSAATDPQATLVMPPARQTEPFPNVSPSMQGIQPQVVRQGVRPAIVYALVALLAMVVAGAAVAIYYERGRHRPRGDANRTADTPAASSPTPTPAETGNKAQPTPEKTPGPENAGGAVPGKYPEGSTRLLSADDAAGKSPWEIKVMKNEIYARHGYIFKTSELKSYFERQSWYRPMYDDVTGLLSKIEIENAAFLKSYE
jgi:hypothetical protein